MEIRNGNGFCCATEKYSMVDTEHARRQHILHPPSTTRERSRPGSGQSEAQSRAHTRPSRQCRSMGHCQALSVGSVAARCLWYYPDGRPVDDSRNMQLRSHAPPSRRSKSITRIRLGGIFLAADISTILTRAGAKPGFWSLSGANGCLFRSTHPAAWVVV